MRGKLNPVAVMRVLVLLALQYMLPSEASFKLPHAGSVGSHLKPFGPRQGSLSHFQGKFGHILRPTGPPNGAVGPLLGPFGPSSGAVFGPRLNGGWRPRFGPTLGPAFSFGGSVSAYNPRGFWPGHGKIGSFGPSGTFGMSNRGSIGGRGPGGFAAGSDMRSAFGFGRQGRFGPGLSQRSNMRSAFGFGRQGRFGPGLSQRSNMRSAFGFGRQGRFGPGLSQGSDLGFSGDFDRASSFMGRQNVDSLQDGGRGRGMGSSRSPLGPLDRRDNDRYRYTWDFNRDTNNRDTRFGDDWGLGSNLDYNNDGSVLLGRLGGRRPASYPRNAWYMTGLDGRDDRYDYLGYGSWRRGGRRDRYGRSGRDRPDYRRYDRYYRGYDRYDNDITRSDNDRRIGDAGGNGDGYYSFGGSQRSSGGRGGRGRGRSYENGFGKSRSISKNDLNKDESKIIREIYIYENNGGSGRTSTNVNSIDRGYNNGGNRNGNRDRLGFDGGNDGFRRNSVDQVVLADGFVESSISNRGDTDGNTIGRNIGDAVGPKMTDVGVSDIALGVGSEINVRAAVRDGVSGNSGVATKVRDGNASGLGVGSDVIGNGGKGSAEIGFAGSGRGIGVGGAGGSVKVYRSGDSSNGGSGTGGLGNGNGGVNMPGGKSKYDFKFTNDDDGTKIMRQTFARGKNSGSSKSASISGSGSVGDVGVVSDNSKGSISSGLGSEAVGAKSVKFNNAGDVGVVSDKGSVSSGLGREAGGATSVKFDKIQATVRDMLYPEKSYKGISSSGDFRSSSSNGNQRIGRVDSIVSDDRVSSAGGSVDSTRNLGISDGLGGPGDNGGGFVKAGDGFGPGSTAKSGSDLKVGGKVEVGKSVNQASKVGVVDGHTDDDESSIHFDVRDLTGWR